MADHPDKGKRRGTMPCDNCGETVSVRVAGQGLLYYICDNKQGGCGYQCFARTRDADVKLAARIAKWDDPAQRRAYLGDAALPAKARRAPEPEPQPEPDPVDDETPEIDEDDPPPPPPPRRAARPAPKPKRAPPPRPARNSIWPFGE